MNPITESLLSELDDENLKAFVHDWDDFETLIKELNRQKSLSFSQQEAFYKLKNRLTKAYPDWGPGLEAFWRRSRVKDAVLTEDPFRSLLSVQTAKELVENWEAMTMLPAAREALNLMLIAKIESGDVPSLSTGA